MLEENKFSGQEDEDSEEKNGGVAKTRIKGKNIVVYPKNPLGGRGRRKPWRSCGKCRVISKRMNGRQAWII